MKKLIAILIISILFSGIAFAREPKGSQPQETAFKARRPLDQAFEGSVNLLLDNRDSLNLSDKQVKKVKELLANTRKELIKINAEIRVLRVDVNTISWEAPLDFNQTNVLVGQINNLSKKRSNLIVNSIKDLHGILNREQLKKFNSLS